MATTTNYSWVTPEDTDLVKDGAAAIRTLGSSADTTVKDLNPGTTAGDIDYYTSSIAKARIAIGTAGQILQVNAGATAPEWAAPAGGGKILQVVSQSLTTGSFSTSSGTYVDTGITLSITPSAATSKVMIFWNASVDSTASPGNGNTISRFVLVRTATELKEVTMGIENNSGSTTNLGIFGSIIYLDSPNTTSAITYKIQAKQFVLGQLANMRATSAFPADFILYEIGA
jgi:hypothetical protein